MGLETVFGHSFLTTRLDAAVNWGRKYSFFQYPFVTACCGMEYMSVFASAYDIARFGAEYPRFSPRQADVIIIAGTVVKKMADPIIQVYNQMPEPRFVISYGSCSNCGGPYYDSYSVVKGVDKIIPVDIYVAGCPPRPEALQFGLIQLQRKIEQMQMSRGGGASPQQDRGARDVGTAA